jgi:hypothetical protein
MNLLYNLFDVNCLISIGEGYGLPTNHACACGKTTIACDNSVQRDLANKTGSMILCNENNFNTFITLDDSYNRKLPNIESLRDCLIYAYEIQNDILKSKEKYTMRESALNFARNIDWETKIVPQWKKLFDETVTKKQRKVEEI